MRVARQSDSSTVFNSAPIFGIEVAPMLSRGGGQEQQRGRVKLPGGIRRLGIFELKLETTTFQLSSISVPIFIPHTRN